MSASTPQNHEPQDPLPGRGVLGWLGRQVGYVKRAVHHDPAIPPQPTSVFRTATVDEQVIPEMPHVKLRRTTIDEVIIDPVNQQAKQ